MTAPRTARPFDADTYSVLVMLTLPLGLYPFYLRRCVSGTLLTLSTLGAWTLLITGLILGRGLLTSGGALLLGLLFAAGLRQAGRAYAVTERLNRRALQQRTGPRTGTPSD